MSKTPMILFVGATVKDNVYFSNQPLSHGAGKFKMVSRRVITGGSGANASIAASELSRIQNLGCEIVLASKIGGGPEDSAPTAAKIRLRGVMISDAIASQTGHEIPVNTAESGSDDRRILVTDHAYPEIDAGYASQLSDLIERAEILQIHTRLPDLAIMAAEIAKAKGTPFVVDASNYDETLDRVLPLATYAVLPDELIMPGAENKVQSNGEAVMDYIKTYNVQYAGVMCGGEDTLVSVDGEDLPPVPVQSSSAFKILDKLGAGDAARAGLLIALQTGQSFSEALQYANLIGTYSCAYDHRLWIDALQNGGADDLYRVTGHRMA